MFILSRAANLLKIVVPFHGDAYNVDISTGCTKIPGNPFTHIAIRKQKRLSCTRKNPHCSFHFWRAKCVATCQGGQCKNDENQNVGTKPTSCSCYILGKFTTPFCFESNIVISTGVKHLFVQIKLPLSCRPKLYFCEADKTCIKYVFR